jgi:hypothetical protein
LVSVGKSFKPIRYLSYEIFYDYYAFQQRQKVSKKALAAQLKTNPQSQIRNYKLTQLVQNESQN